MKVAALFVLLLLQESDEAKKARADLEQVKARIEKLLKLRERIQKNDEQFRAGAEDEERLKKLAQQRQQVVQEFQDFRSATMKAMDALLASATEGLKKSPDDPGLLDVRAEAYLMFDRKDEALPDLEKLAKMRPEDPELALKLARLQHGLNRYEGAAGNLEKYLVKSPGHLESRTLLAMSYFALHRFDDSIQLFDAILKEKLEPQQLQMSTDFRRMAASCADLWKAEQEIRAREAKADDLPRVRLTTSKGEIEMELFENEAPNAVANFVELMAKKFYDGLNFHRVIPGFMVQGGCPKGDGSGDPGYRFKDENQGAYRRHFRGALSMANSGPDTNGSQFFITHLPTEWLNGKHTVFGRVTRGLDVVDALKAGDSITKAEVVRKRDHEYHVAKIAETKNDGK